MIKKMAISPGDPAGIGPDICIKAFAVKKPLNFIPVIFSDPLVLEKRAKELGRKINIKEYSKKNYSFYEDTLFISEINMEEEVVAGIPNPKNALTTLLALKIAAHKTINNEFDALVTGPINKKIMNDGGVPFQGHTEFLAKESKTDQQKAVEVARNILETSVRDLLINTDTDYSTKINLNINSKKLADRGCTIDNIVEKLESNKKFKTEVLGDSILLKLVDEESDAPTVIALRNKVLKTTVKGVKDVKRVTIIKKDNEWVIQTTGSNLGDVVKVAGIDKENVRTNNVAEIAETLGIEAARNALINELSSTLEDQGLEVDQRYLMLVSDLMCHRGYMQQIGRHGIAGTKDSVLARAAFEITVPTIANAAKTGETEELKGITENVIVGSQIPIGSGTVDLYMQVAKKREVKQ